MNPKLASKDWRLANLYKIVTKEQKMVRFEENAIQKAVRVDPSLRKMILKARQFGVSTGCILDFFDDVCFKKNLTCVILAHEDKAIERLFRIVRRAYDNMPEKIRPVLDRGGGSKYEMFFPARNSRIYCALEVRGDTIHRLHVSEAAFMADAERLKATMEAVPILNGRVNIETTANGMNHFYDKWVDPTQNYKKMFFPWFVFPSYRIELARPIRRTIEEEEFAERALRQYGVAITDEQIQFRRFKKSELKEKFIQEYPEDDRTCFLASGGAVMDLMKVSEIIAKAEAPIEESEWFRLYEEPSKNEIYVIGADTAEGVQSDYSHATVINVRTLKVVATMRSNRWKPSAFAEKLNWLGEKFHNHTFGHPLIAVERNNHGHAVLVSLEDTHHYPNIFCDHDERKGWITSKVSRPIMFDMFVDAVETEVLEIHDQWVLGECLTLVDHDGKSEAEDGKHDDGIVATAIGLQMALVNSNLEVYRDIEKKILV